MNKLIGFFLVLLSSCSTLNKKECIITNRTLIAREDVKNERSSMIKNYVETYPIKENVTIEYL